MASSSPGTSRITKRGVLALIVVIALAGSVGFSVWWFWLRGPNEVEKVEEGVQRGKFSLDLNEEKKISFPRPYASKPYLSIEDSHGFFTVIEIQPAFFRVKSNPDSSVQNQPWESRGVLAP